MQDSAALKFEQFTYRDPIPRYGNFYCYFIDGDRSFASKVYRRKEHFLRFQRENADMEGNLTFKLTAIYWNKVSTSEKLKPFDKELYDAYLIMRNYVESDIDLFR